MNSKIIIFFQTHVASLNTIEEFTPEFGWEFCRTCFRNVPPLARFAAVVLPFEWFEECHCVPDKFRSDVCIQVVDRAIDPLTHDWYNISELAPKDAWLLDSGSSTLSAEENVWIFLNLGFNTWFLRGL